MYKAIYCSVCAWAKTWKRPEGVSVQDWLNAWWASVAASWSSSFPFFANRNSISLRWTFPEKGTYSPSPGRKPALVWSEVGLRSLVPSRSHHLQAMWAGCHSTCCNITAKCLFQHLPYLHGKILRCASTLQTSQHLPIEVTRFWKSQLLCEHVKLCVFINLQAHGHTHPSSTLQRSYTYTEERPARSLSYASSLLVFLHTGLQPTLRLTSNQKMVMGVGPSCSCLRRNFPQVFLLMTHYQDSPSVAIPFPRKDVSDLLSSPQSPPRSQMPI